VESGRDGNRFLRFTTLPFDERTPTEINRGGGNTNQRTYDTCGSVGVRTPASEAELNADGRTVRRGFDTLGAIYLNKGPPITYAWRFRVNDASALREGLIRQAVLGQLHQATGASCPSCGQSLVSGSPSPGVYLRYDPARATYVLSVGIKQDARYDYYWPDPAQQCDVDSGNACQITVWEQPGFTLGEWHSIGFTVVVDNEMHLPPSAGCVARQLPRMGPAAYGACAPSRGSLRIIYDGFEQVGMGRSSLPWVSGQLEIKGIQTAFGDCPSYLSVGIYALGYHRAGGRRGLEYDPRGGPTGKFLDHVFSRDAGAGRPLREWIAGGAGGVAPPATEPPPSIEVDYDSIVIFEAFANPSSTGG
jgi:hypothetical protein